jgi:hypothetical protein
MDRQKYLFECMLRRPSFQEELLNFLRDFPVFFRFRRKLLRRYGGAERQATKEWKTFFSENEARIEKVEESDETTYYKYVPHNARQAAEESFGLKLDCGE